MQCWHLNPRPFDHESPNITTTPGQPNLTQVSIQEQYNSCRRSTVDLMKQFTTQFSQTLTVHFATQWIRLRLPTCRPRFESQAHHICFYHLVIVKVVLYLSCEKNENKQKRPYLAHLKRKILTQKNREFLSDRVLLWIQSLKFIIGQVAVSIPGQSGAYGGNDGQ